jgi:hypothetical protein
MTATLCHCTQMIQGQYDPAKAAAVAIGTLVAHIMGTRELARWRGAVPAPQCRTPVSGKVREPARAMHVWLGVVVILWVLIAVTLVRWVPG